MHEVIFNLLLYIHSTVRRGKFLHSYVFFLFLSQARLVSVNNLQGIRLHKPSKMKLLRATKLQKRGMISVLLWVIEPEI